jgi:acetylornithine deacetylase
MTCAPRSVDSACAAFVAAGIPRWERLFRALIRTPSLFENEHAIVRLVEDHLTSLGISVVRVRHDPGLLRTLPGAQQPISEVDGRFSLVARVPGANTGRSLVLSSHLDTVGAGDPDAWQHPPFSAHLDERTRTLYGRGAMDDKAGVTIALAVFETLLKAPVRLNGDVIFHFVLEDETTGNGTLLCIEAGHVGDAALIIDGTRPTRAIDEHAGMLHLKISVRGRPASVSVAHTGINAAEVLMGLLRHLQDAVRQLNETRVEPWTEFPSPYQFVTQVLQSDSDRLTLPERADARVCVTFPPPYTLDRMDRFLLEQVDAYTDACSLPERPVLDRMGLAVEPTRSDAAALRGVLQKCAEDHGLGPVGIGPSTGTSDLRHFVNAGIPCLLYGPGTGFNPHRPNERYELRDLQPMIQTYLAVVQEWCGVQAS